MPYLRGDAVEKKFLLATTCASFKPLQKKYLIDCPCVVLKEFAANSDRDTVVFHELSEAIRARYIRIRPTAWHAHISMRVELFGCKGRAS